MKIKLLPIFYLLSSALSFSQELSISASSGYNFGFAQGNLEVFHYNKLVGAFSNPYPQQKKYSLGNGINYEINGYYQFKGAFGLKLNVNYLQGLGQEHVFNSYNTEVQKLLVTTKANFLRLGGGIFVNSNFGKCILRSEFNVQGGWGEMTFIQDDQYNGVSMYKYTNRFSGGFSLGLSGTLTLLYPLNEQFHLFASANFFSGFYSPRVYRCISAKDGNNNLHMELYEREGIFVKEPHNINDPNRRIELIRENFTASSLGLQLGVQFRLWKKAEKKDA